MRNVFVLPDGTEQHFMYPVERDIEIGDRFAAHFSDNSDHILTLTSIVHEEKRILYKLSY
ncbi:hypothetical protein TCA2_4452 [Paenibacillus sp. TCA20]|uniref:Uncharacterized protein n=1 Tax=Paenibacillus urinalis TaxID=521520 RepID=A0ABY7XH92_9BACL|nr:MULTISPECIES: hypothetical protein [Paenibacillus]WDI05211.1 hypothetical protein PUW25_25725 [Paenibacillus urinalis]GAK41960.1 hypothetical protein TCA2_4452 [Paenibacillus sp. TCA20]